MKVVIDIDDETYNLIKNWNRPPKDTVHEMLFDLLRNGTPLKEVLGDIQIELQRLADDKWNQEVGSSKGLEDAIDVIEDQKERDS